MLLDLGDYLRPVPFDQPAATALVEQFWAVSSKVNGAIGALEQESARVRGSFQGFYAEQFARQVQIRVEDGERLVASLRRAADALEELAQAARAEELRRELVRDGIDRWEAASVEFAAVGQPPPPLEEFLPRPYEPIEPPIVPIPDCAPAPRPESTPT